MPIPLDHSLSILARTPAVFDALLRTLPDDLARANEGENTWSAWDIVGHLIYADRADWMPRARRILEFEESRPFDPFDRNGHLRECEGKSLPQLLDDFADVRRERLAELRGLGLSHSDLRLRGLHPALGSVTLSELLSTWAAHDLNHLHQVSRVLANAWRESVGPFSKFLGVMQCNAHGA
jgi:hypothetical protein